MARETFPRKKPGDSLEASHVNKLSRVARRLSNFPIGSHQIGKQGGTFSGSGPYPHWTQAPVEITNKKIDSDDSENSGLYLCKIRYFDGEEWQLQDQEYQLDANSIKEKYEVEDIVTAYFSRQRGLWLPITFVAGIQSFIEVEGVTTTTIEKETGEDSYEVEFWLERSSGGPFTIVGGRTFFINAYHESEDISVTGVGFITFLAQHNEVFRLVVRVSEVLEDVSSVLGVMKFTSLDKDGITTSDTSAPDATVVGRLRAVAEVNNNDGELRWPKYEIQNTLEGVRIQTPKEETWTIEADVLITAVIQPSSASSVSTSSISTSSQSDEVSSVSSISTSSPSSQSMSSISTSSSSGSSTSSSSTSSSSTSSDSSSSSDSSTSSSSSISTSSTGA